MVFRDVPEANCALISWKDIFALFANSDIEKGYNTIGFSNENQVMFDKKKHLFWKNKTIFF